jgi:hypothetical protein
MRRILLAFTALAALVAALYWAGEQLLARSATQAVAALEQALPPGSKLAHGEISTSLWRREVALADVRIDLPTHSYAAFQTIGATRLKFQGVPWLSREAFSLGRVALQNMTLQGRLAMKAAELVVIQPSFNLSPRQADELHLAGLGFESVGATQVEVQYPEQQFVMKASVVRLGALQTLRLSRAEIHDMTVEQQLQDGPDKLQVAMAQGQDIRLDDLLQVFQKRDLFGLLAGPVVQQAEVRELVLQRGDIKALSIGQITLGGQLNDAQVRTSVEARAQQIQFNPQALPSDTAKHLAAMGYEMLNSELSLTAKYDPVARQLNINPLLFEIADGFRFKAGLQLGEVIFPGVQRPAGLTISGIGATNLIGVQLELAELGMIGRHIRTEAARLQIKPQIYVEQRIGAWAPEGLPPGPGTQKIGQLYRSLGTFMMEPYLLTLTAQPPQPVPVFALMMNFGRPDVLAETLDVKASARLP